jgi:hypothetical protein
MEFLRRLGPDPHEGGQPTPNLSGCPDIWELGSGDFLVIGRNLTGNVSGALPATASCGPDEAAVVIPRAMLVRAKQDIPER